MNMPPVRTDAFSLRGGLSLNRSALEAKPGTLIECLNYEPYVAGGYNRIKGYERFDGHPSPSDATYTAVAATLLFGNSLTAGDTITIGAATCVFIQEVTGGFIATKVSTTIPNNTSITKSAVPQGTTAADAALDYSPTNAEHAQHLYDAATRYRGDIAAVPGSGNILGVWYYDDNVYAFRDHTDGLSCKMWKATAAGWDEVDLGYALLFDGGVGAIAEGDTITGATSGASCVVRRIEIHTGTWAGSNATGIIITDAITSGPFQNNENLQISAVTKAVANGASAAQALSPNGRYEFVNGNFGAQTTSYRMYGCDGVNKAFEFNGTYYVPIYTGATVDTPSSIAINANHLFLALGASIMHSELGFPHRYDASLTAGEIGVGDTITGLVPTTGQACAVISRNSIRAVLGTSSADWQLQTIAPEVGGLEHTMQPLGAAVAMVDDRGVIEVVPGQNYGNFDSDTVSRGIQNIIDNYRDTFIGSCVLRNKNQYRAFTSDGTQIVMRTEPGGARDFTIVRFPDIPVCVCSEESGAGVERIFFGDSAGMVYEMEKGTSFDGDNILSAMVTWPVTAKSPTIHKTFRHAWIEVKTELASTIELSPQFDYEAGDTMPSTTGEYEYLYEARGAGGRWESSYFESFFWDGPYVEKFKMDIDGSGYAIAFVILSDSAIDKGHNIRAVEYTYTPRRQRR